MAERHRSQDGIRETDDIPGVKEAREGGISQQGRSGGNLDRDVGTQADEARATSPDTGVPRVRGEDKRNHGTEPADRDD